MASLALGVAGAAVGTMFGPMGASIGWMLGSAAGSALFPGKGTDGPRLSDLKVQGSTYGAAIPVIYGSMRISGNAIWMADLTEHKHTQGGKGGPSVTTYTYTGSAAFGLCEGPIAAVLRIWADGRLVYDSITGSGGIVFTLYQGDEAQLPDPTMEAVLGVGNVPAHRGMAYVVFSDLDLGEYGNRWPLFTFEVSTNAAQTGHIRIVMADHDEPYTFGGGYGGGSGRPTLPQWIYPAVEGDQIRAVAMGTNTTQTFSAVDLSYMGPETSIPPENTYPLPFKIEHLVPPDYPIYNYVSIGNYIRTDGTRIPIWTDLDQPIGTTVYNCGLIGYGATLSGDISIATMNFGHEAGIPGGLYVLHASMSADGKKLYVVTRETPSSGAYHWYKIVDLAIVADGTVAGPGVFGYGNIGIGAAAGQLVGSIYDVSVWENDADYCWVFDGAEATSIALFSIIGGVLAEDAIGGYLVSQYTGGGFSWPAITSPALGYAGVAVANDLMLYTRWLEGTSDEVTLASIVSDLSVRAGLQESQFDVSDLTDLVHGYLVADQADVRSAITPLQVAYNFDCVESGTQIKFVKRGADSVATITDDELAAHEGSGDPPAVLEFERIKEQDLPRRVSMSYLDQDSEYQQGTQLAQRQITSSHLESSVELPIALTATETKQIANRVLWMLWYERDTFKLFTTRKYAYLEPTDTIIAHGRSLRITAKTEQPGGVLEWSGVQTLGAIFTSGSGEVGVSGGGISGGGGEVTLPQASQLEILDIAYIADPSRQNVYWAAMAGAERATWRGAALYQSKDAINYEAIAAEVTPDIIGSADTVIGTFLGGNVFDEVNSVDVTIGPGGGELSSTTRDGVLNGTNEFLLGPEILQARDAVLVSGTTYRLSGFLRGRRGTEWAMANHITGERFVPIPVNELSYQSTDVGAYRQYKAVTNGNTLDSATAQAVILRGVSMTPYSPVLPSAGINASGDWILQWYRRARVNGTWLNFTDVPLDETTESYRVTLWTDSLYTTIAGTIDCATTTTTVTAAQQTAIFGVPQSELFWSVAQMGRFGPGYDTLGRAPTVLTPPPTIPVLPTTPTDAVYLGELRFDGSQITTMDVTDTKVAYGLIVIPNPLPAAWWSGKETYVSIFESGSGTYAKRMYLSRSPFDYTAVYPAYSEGDGSANIFMIFDASSAYAVTVAPGDIWYVTIKNELPDGTPSCPPGGNGNFGLRMYPPNI